MADYPDYTSLMQIIGSDIMVPIDVQAAYIMMPIDIQAQYVTLEIDIIAQSVGNIAIDIAAQTLGNIAVNIAASAVTLNVSIASIAGGVTFNIGTVSGTVNVAIQSSAVTLNIAIQSSAVTLNVNITNTTINVSGSVTATISGTVSINITAQNVGVYLQPEWAAKTGVDKNFLASTTNVAFGSGIYGDYTVATGKTLYICGFSCDNFAYNQADADSNQMCCVYLTDMTTDVRLAEIGGNGGAGMVLSKPIAIPSGHQFRYRVTNRANHYTSLGITVWGYEV